MSGKVLVIANQKGGVGKTSIALHLFHYAKLANKRVLLIDCDEQANASYSLEAGEVDCVSEAASDLFLGSLDVADCGYGFVRADASIADVERIDIDEAMSNASSNFDRLRERFDLIIIDTAPTVRLVMVAVLASADFVLSPVHLEAFSIHGVDGMATIIENMQAENPNLQHLGMVANKVDMRNPVHKEWLEAIEQSEWSQFLLPYNIRYRNSVSVAVSSGVPIWAVKKTAARVATKEVKAVCSHVLEKMGIEHEQN